jgi:flavin-dependent dehydrogenase
MQNTYDVVVVGARCAGAATAMLLAEAGARVLLVERGAYGTDTLSTHALMRGAVLQLHRWGVLPAVIAAGTPPVRSTIFHYTDDRVTVTIEPRDGVTALYAPRRALLDRLLVDAASARGAHCEFGAHVSDVVRDHAGRVSGIALRGGDGRERRVAAGLVIGADGIHSTIAKRVGARTRHTSRYAAAVLYAYWPGAPVDGYQWFYRPELSVGAISTNEAACVFVAMPAARFRTAIGGGASAAYHRLLAEAAPGFYETLGAARHVEHVRGFSGHPGYLKESHGPGWSLVGDAGYFKDPLTAHGITDALRDAELLARAVLKGGDEALARYETTRDDLSRELFAVTDAIASFEWDDERLQPLHRALSQEMSREVRAIAQLEPLPCLSSLANERRAV